MNQTEDGSMQRTTTITTAHQKIHDAGVVYPQDDARTGVHALWVVQLLLCVQNGPYESMQQSVYGEMQDFQI